MVGDVAAAVDAVEAGCVGRQSGFVKQQVLGLAAFAQGVGVRVLAAKPLGRRGPRYGPGRFSLAVLGL